jgi:glutamine---fructose-6-phosphate transaminase (isomerizing)
MSHDAKATNASDDSCSTSASNVEGDNSVPEITPFEQDILEQPAALRRQAGYDLPEGIRSLVEHGWDRIILTGMGSSHFAGVPTWRALARLGLPVWAIDTSKLLDTPGLVTPRTLVIATSQSGESAEIVEMLNRVDSGTLKMGELIGVTDSASSALAQGSTITAMLNSGPEATVSTKSYLNSLAVHARLATAFAAGDDTRIVAEIDAAADSVATMIHQPDLEPRANSIIAESNRRIVAIGQGNDGATAHYAALIVKEASKVAVEGFVGGQFRHGPFELAGPGLTAILFGLRSRGRVPTLLRLAGDLVATGSQVLVVGDVRVDGAETLWSPPSSLFGELANDAVVAELLAVALARANGVSPGSFAFGSKITTAL